LFPGSVRCPLGPVPLYGLSGVFDLGEVFLGFCLRPFCPAGRSVDLEYEYKPLWKYHKHFFNFFLFFCKKSGDEQSARHH